MDGGVDGCMDGWMDGWMGGRMYELFCFIMKTTTEILEVMINQTIEILEIMKKTTESLESMINTTSGFVLS